jgi:O-antigen/teichoic acid export membrane protein
MGLSDRAILGAHVELAEVGVYTLAYQFALIIQVVNLAVDGSWRAFLFRAVNDLKKHLWIQRLATYYVVGIAFVGWGIAVFGVDVIKLATPVSYHRAILVLPFLCLATYLLVFYQIWSDGVLAIKNTKGLPIIAMIAALLGVTLNLLLIPRYGIFAAALNSIIMYSTLAACAYFLASKLNLLSYEYVRWVKVTLVAIVLGLIAYHLSLGSELLDILAKFGLIFIWPFFLYLIGFWTEQEVIAIKAALSRLLHGSWSNSRS